MEKIIYDERALRAFKSNFERVKANLMHVHECDMGLVGIRSELIVQLYKACDYRCLYRFMPLHGIGVMEQSRLIGKCSDYILRDFIRHFLADTHSDCLRACCDGLYRDDDDIDIIDYDKLDEAERQILAEISDLKNPQLCMCWKTALEWVKEHDRVDELKLFIRDTYVKKDTSVVAKKEPEEHIEVCGGGEDWRFDDPKVQKGFLFGGLSVGDWLKHKINEWRKVKC